MFSPLTRTLLLAISLLGSTAFAQDAAFSTASQTPQHFEQTVSVSYAYDYLLYLPKDYEKAADTKFPLVIFLHGSGERGTDVNLVKKNGLAHVLETKDFPFVCISPQCPPGSAWKIDSLNALLDSALTRYRVDPDRVIITGLSLGGFGTWEWAGSNPERFAAAVPVCGGGNPIRARAMRNVPVWAFHGGDDKRVPIAWQEMMIDTLKGAGAQPKWTVYPGVGHELWVQAYAEPELYEWMLAQRRQPRPAGDPPRK